MSTQEGKAFALPLGIITFTVSVLHSCEPVSLATRELSVEAHFSFSRTPIACMNLLYCYAIQRPAVVYTYCPYELYSCIQQYACALLRVLRAERGAQKKRNYSSYYVQERQRGQEERAPKHALINASPIQVPADASNQQSHDSHKALTKQH